MAIRFYDEAVYNKIQKWIKDPNMRILKPDEVTRLFQVQADENDDRPLSLPLIALSRESEINIDISTKRNLTFDGIKLIPDELSIEEIKKLTSSAQLNVIPISLNYQLDIFTRHYAEADEYLRNFIFNLVNYPKIKVNIEYNGFHIEQICYIHLMQTISDNSDISERLFPGQFTRWTIQFEIQNAYLFSVPITANKSISAAELDIYNPNAVNYSEDQLDIVEEIGLVTDDSDD